MNRPGGGVRRGGRPAGSRGLCVAVVVDRDVPPEGAAAAVAARLADEFVPDRLAVACLAPSRGAPFPCQAAWPVGFIDDGVPWAAAVTMVDARPVDVPVDAAGPAGPPDVVEHLRRRGLVAQAAWSPVGWRSTIRLVARVCEGTDLLLAVTGRRRLLAGLPTHARVELVGLRPAAIDRPRGADFP